MKHVDITPVRMTSVTLRLTTRSHLASAIDRLNSVNIAVSEQRLMRECLRFALRFWRGRGAIATRNKRYNQRTGPFEIVPFCSTEALRAVSWARCHHGGLSFSRMMDFAINAYLDRVVEQYLSARFFWRDKEDLAAWQKKFENRRKSIPFIINYYESTRINDGIVLNFEEKSEIRFMARPQAGAA